MQKSFSPSFLTILTNSCKFSFQIFLLPCHSDKSKRRTKALASTNEPRWGQIFTFPGLRRADLNNRSFEASSILIFLLEINQSMKDFCILDLSL